MKSTAQMHESMVKVFCGANIPQSIQKHPEPHFQDYRILKQLHSDRARVLVWLPPSIFGSKMISSGTIVELRGVLTVLLSSIIVSSVRALRAIFASLVMVDEICGKVLRTSLCTKKNQMQQIYSIYVIDRGQMIDEGKPCLSRRNQYVYANV
ncbi:hypothetical protein ADUPG1_012817 [Aduncisulcus paluster]|uniref:Uncharacterized protein n=1 Tax=Aduncisulcus paluster TaxID=2918883 RepID=A0ABQ5K400_9EUKA|nr:hypothetical protein ADUPG1_012817 [Aduncisulcus paluster]